MVRLPTVIVAALLLAGIDQTAHASDKPLLGIVIGANVIDLVTTEMARASGNGREANPLLQNQKVFWGIKAASTTVEVMAVHQLWTRKHHLAAIGVAAFIGGFHGWGGQHNLMIARGMK